MGHGGEFVSKMLAVGGQFLAEVGRWRFVTSSCGVRSIIQLSFVFVGTSWEAYNCYRGEHSFDAPQVECRSGDDDNWTDLFNVKGR